MLFPNGGWGLSNELEMLYLTDFGLILGVQYTIVHAFYPDSAFLSGEPTDNPNTPVHRVGPLAVYTFFDHPGARFNSPSLFIILQWYARHRYRTGEDTHAALPRIVFGFAFEGDLFP